MSPDGTPNPKYVDLLDEDPKISGQHFACVSFVSPGKILKSRVVKKSYGLSSLNMLYDLEDSSDIYIPLDE